MELKPGQVTVIDKKRKIYDVIALALFTNQSLLPWKIKVNSVDMSGIILVDNIFDNEKCDL